MENLIWRIELLGGLRVWLGDEEVCRLRATRSAALLGYLALSGNRVHPREELIDRFWPQAPSLEVGRHNLRQELFTLRKQLRVSGAVETFLVSDASSIELKRHAYLTDVAEMESLLYTAARIAPPLQCIEALEKGVELYRGELLPGHYDAWVLNKRYYLEQLVQQTWETLSHAWVKQGDFERATRYVLQTLIADPHRETSRAHLAQFLQQMRAHQTASHHDGQMSRLLERLQKLPGLGEPTSAHDERQTRQLRRELKRWQQTLPAPSPPERNAINLAATPAVIKLHEAPRHFLPTPLKRLIGRATELSEIVACLADAHDSPTRLRCLTVLGPGGIGKTRFAIAAAQQLKTQYRTIVFVPLAALSAVQLLPQTIASALHLPDAGEATPDSLLAHLQTQPTLLVLDNLEHLAVEAVPLLEWLLQRVPSLRCLLTSRRLLHLAGERAYTLAPLSLPLSLEDADSNSASVQLFVERARETQGDFALTPRNVAQVNALCVALEGVPLAIELVAARIAMFTLPEMIAGLENRLALLTDETDEREARHRSVSAALQWSLELLPPAVRDFLRGLSIFHGGWTCEAASAVCGEPHARDYLERLRVYFLVSSQFVAPNLEKTALPDEAALPVELRFGMLETVRAYGWAQMSADERDARARAHADFYAAFCDDAPANYSGRSKVWKIEQFDREYPNIRAALQYLHDAPENQRAARRAQALRMVHKLAPSYWFVRGFFREQRFWLAQLLDAESASASSQSAALDVARAHYNLGVAAIMQTDWDSAAVSLDVALRQFRVLEDAANIGYALNKIGVVAQARGDYERARELFEESRACCEGRGHGRAHRRGSRFQMSGLSANRAGRIPGRARTFHDGADNLSRNSRPGGDLYDADRTERVGAARR